MKYLMGLLTFLLWHSTLYSIPQPKPPDKPTPPMKTKKQEPPKKEKKEITENHRVEIIISKGSKTKGVIKLKNNPITIITKQGDFVYKRNVLMSDIKSIEIITWQESKIEKKGLKDETPYVFYPVVFKVKTKDKQKYLYKGRLPYLEKITLTNILGNTTLHSIFYDYWMTKDNKRYWLNSRSKNFSYNKKKPHPLVVKKIIFLK